MPEPLSKNTPCPFCDGVGWEQDGGTRCGTCRWWGAPFETYTEDDDHRPCWLISGDPRIEGKDPAHDAQRTDKVWVWPWAGADDGMVATTADFGCVLWEARHA
jgi:hypothetical protein